MIIINLIIKKLFKLIIVFFLKEFTCSECLCICDWILFLDIEQPSARPTVQLYAQPSFQMSTQLS